jgi:hypothetical protein
MLYFSYIIKIVPSQKVEASSSDEVNAFVSMYLIFPAAQRPWGLDSASNRNEYQYIFLGVKRGRRVRLTT